MKRLIVCCDGTWQKRDAGTEGGTHVAAMERAILPKARDGTLQRVWYDAGVGTDGNLLQRLAAGATGRGLEQNVEEAYRFLVETHEPGDEVWLFGFSRGAFTARSVVGMLRKCGLLRSSDPQSLRDAYRFYRGEIHPDHPEAVAFRARHARPGEVRVRFLGVWDTVGSLGIPWGPLRWMSRRRHGFHDVRLSGIVDVARHAVAIDERRNSFVPSLWETKHTAGQSVQQAWFAGAHSAVGGGDGTSGLPDLAFLWMKEEAQAAGLHFDDRHVKRRFHPDPAGRLAESRKGIWRLLPGGWRPIGDPTHEPQSIHASALERHGQAALAYRPPNLVEYLERVPHAAPAPPARAVAAPEAGKRRGPRRRARRATGRGKSAA